MWWLSMAKRRTKRGFLKSVLNTTESPSSVTTPPPANQNPSDNNTMATNTVYISAGAAGGTVLVVLIIVIVCICCRCGRKKKGDRENQGNNSLPHSTTDRNYDHHAPPPGKRPDPIGVSDSMLKSNRTGDFDDRNQHYQRRDPASTVYKVDGPPVNNNGHQYKPYVVGGPEMNAPHSMTRSDSAGPGPPPFNSLSIPRPALKTQTSNTSDQQKSKYTAANLLGPRANQEPVYNTSINQEQERTSNTYGNITPGLDFTPHPDYPNTSPQHQGSINSDARPRSPDVQFRVHPDYNHSSRPNYNVEDMSNSSNAAYDTRIETDTPAHDVRTKEDTVYEQNRAVIERRYRQRTEKEHNDETPQQHYGRDPQLSRDEKVKSGKYETQITPYMGSTYALSGDFTNILDPQEPHPQTIDTIPRNHPQPPEVHPKPNRKPTIATSSHHPEPKHPITTYDTNSNQLKPRVVQNSNYPPKVEENHEPKEEKNELSNNPVFNKRKDLIAKECKTIRLKDDQMTDTHPHLATNYDNQEQTLTNMNKRSDAFERLNPDTNEDEDPYWKIRESRLMLNVNDLSNPAVTKPSPKSLKDHTYSNTTSTAPPYFNILPPTKKTNNQGYGAGYINNGFDDGGRKINNRLVSSVVYDDVVPNKNTNGLREDVIYDDNEYPDYDDTVYPPPMKRAHTKQEVGEDGLTDTARRRLPSMRASMPPDALNSAIDEIFQDAIADSELDLSRIPSEPQFSTTNSSNSSKAISSSGNSPTRQNQQSSKHAPPVLKRKTKLEESRIPPDHLSPQERESWRISRSSFYDEIGVHDRPTALITEDKDNINSAMVKKAMALRDENKPFNYMTVK